VPPAKKKSTAATTILATGLPIGMGIGILGMDSALWGVAIGWGLVAIFALLYLLFRRRPQ
jgi:predicted benzoate:H+ symporter BenE